MKGLAFAIALALLIAAPLARAEDQNAPPVLTNEQLSSVFEGLMALDSYDRIIKDGASEKVTKQYFEYGKGLRKLIGDNIVEVRKALVTLTDRNNELIRQYAKGAAKVPDEALPDFLDAQRKLQREPAGAKLQWIKDDELQLDVNKQITGSALGNLKPIRQ